MLKVRKFSLLVVHKFLDFISKNLEEVESRLLLHDINSLINVTFLFMFQTDLCRVYISDHNDFVDIMYIECSLEKKGMIIVSAFAKKT